MNPTGLNPIINPITPGIAHHPAGIIQPTFPIQAAEINLIAARQHYLSTSSIEGVSQILPFLPMDPTVSQVLDEIRVYQRSKTAALRLYMVD